MINPEEIIGRHVVVRGDLDVSVSGGQIESAFRLEALIPTLELCLKHAKKTLLIGHMGRPEGNDPSFSLKPVQEWLKNRLNQEIPLIVSGYSPGECWAGEFPLCLMENLRFDKREEILDYDFAHQLTAGANVYIYDAFATYRPCTSMQTIPESVHTLTGIQFDKEVATLDSVLKVPTHPTLLLASGAKLDKLEIIKQIMPKFDLTILGGKFAPPQDLLADGFDINQATIDRIKQAIAQSSTIVLNGPLGKFEETVYAHGTQEVLDCLKKSGKTCILGGGDTISAIEKLGFAYGDFTFVSTGGGAMLEYLATSTHPFLDAMSKLP